MISRYQSQKVPHVSAIGGARRFVETVCFDLLGDSSAEAADFTDYPFVDGQAACRGVEPVHVAAFVHLAEARRIPELGGEIAVTLDAAA